jgi:hypothetical protein
MMVGEGMSNTQVDPSNIHNQPSPIDALPQTSSMKSTLSLCSGFICFGFALSWTAGLTQQSGSGTALLTGFFSFVAGAFVSFAGFRLYRHDSKNTLANPPNAGDASIDILNTRNTSPAMPIDGARFGIVLAALSVGVIMGGPIAFLVRMQYSPLNQDQIVAQSRQRQPSDPADRPQQTTQTSLTRAPYVYQSDIGDACGHIKDALGTKANARLLARAASDLLETCEHNEQCSGQEETLVRTAADLRATFCRQE